MRWDGKKGIKESKRKGEQETEQIMCRIRD